MTKEIKMPEKGKTYLTVGSGRQFICEEIDLNKKTTTLIVRDDDGDVISTRGIKLSHFWEEFKEENLCLLQAWEKATQELADAFVEKYYGEDASEIFWVGDEIGDLLMINDYCWNVGNMVDAFRWKCSKKRLLEWYELCIEEKCLVSLRNYSRHGKKMIKIINPSPKKMNKTKKELEKEIKKFKASDLF